MSASDKPLAPCMVCQPIWIELGLPPEAALRWADTERDGCATLTWWDILISWHDLILSSVNTSGLPRSLRGAEFTSTCPGTRQSPRPIWEILVNCHVRHKKFQLFWYVTSYRLEREIPQLSFSEIPPPLYIFNCAGVQKGSKANFPPPICSHMNSIIPVSCTPNSQNTWPQATEVGRHRMRRLWLNPPETSYFPPLPFFCSLSVK